MTILRTIVVGTKDDIAVRTSSGFRTLSVDNRVNPVLMTSSLFSLGYWIYSPYLSKYSMSQNREELCFNLTDAANEVVLVHMTSLAVVRNSFTSCGGHSTDARFEKANNGEGAANDGHQAGEVIVPVPRDSLILYGNR